MNKNRAIIVLLAMMVFSGLYFANEIQENTRIESQRLGMENLHILWDGQKETFDACLLALSRNQERTSVRFSFYPGDFSDNDLDFEHRRLGSGNNQPGEGISLGPYGLFSLGFGRFVEKQPDGNVIELTNKTFSVGGREYFVTTHFKETSLSSGGNWIEVSRNCNEITVSDP